MLESIADRSDGEGGAVPGAGGGLRRGGGAMTSPMELSARLERVLEQAMELLHAERGSVMLLDEDAGELTVRASRGLDPSRLFRVPVGEGIAGWVAQHGEPLLVPDVSQDPRFCVQMDRMTGFRSRSILCVPLKSRERVIGVLEAINKRGEAGDSRFTQADLELLTTLASWVAVAVENAWLNRATKEMAAAAAFKQAVTALAHHINNRLMALSLELDGLEMEGTLTPQALNALTASARRSIQEISAVVKALDRLEELHTVPYVGSTEMIDIEEQLQEQLRLIEAQQR